MILNLFCKQISVTVIIFDRNGGDYRYVFMENYCIPLWISASSPVHCSCGFVIYLYAVPDPEFI